MATQLEQKDIGRASLFESLSAISSNRMILALVVAVVPLLIYSPLSHFLFVNYDDNGYLNYHVQGGPTWENIKWAFTTYYFANWHPITWLAHMLDCRWFGLNPAGHHMTNLLLHCMNAVLLFLVLKNLTGCRGRSFLVAMLFAIHPLNVQSVAWISEKKNLLSTLFLLLAIAAYAHYVRRPRIWRYCVVLVLFVLGLMAKPMIITFPILLLLLDYWPLERFHLGEEKKKHDILEPPHDTESQATRTKKNSWHTFGRLFAEKVPFFLLSAASAIVTMYAQQSLGAIHNAHFGLMVRLENAAISYVSYISKTFWPVRLAVFYPHPGDSISGWQALFALSLLLAITAIAIWKKDRRYLAVGWFAYLGTLVPVIGLIQVGFQSMADRYAYLPLIGLFIIVVWAAADFLTSVSARWIKAASGVLTFLVLVTLAMDTREQLSYWHDGVSLFSHAVAVTPENDTSHSKLAEALEATGHADEALAEFESYLARHPNDASAQYNVASALWRRGRTREAIDGLQRTLSLAQTPYVLGHTHYQLANILLKLGDTSSAERHYRKAVEISPTEYDAHMQLALILEQSRRVEEAIPHFQQCLKMDMPDAFFNLGQAYEKEGRFAEALATYQQALRIVPGSKQMQEAIAAVEQKLHQH